MWKCVGACSVQTLGPRAPRCPCGPRTPRGACAASAAAMARGRGAWALRLVRKNKIVVASVSAVRSLSLLCTVSADLPARCTMIKGESAALAVCLVIRVMFCDARVCGTTTSATTSGADLPRGPCGPAAPGLQKDVLDRGTKSCSGASI